MNQEWGWQEAIRQGWVELGGGVPRIPNTWSRALDTLKSQWCTLASGPSSQDRPLLCSGCIAGRLAMSQAFLLGNRSPEVRTHSMVDIEWPPSEPNAFISSFPFQSVLGKVAPIRQPFHSETFL